MDTDQLINALSSLSPEQQQAIAGALNGGQPQQLTQPTQAPPAWFDESVVPRYEMNVGDDELGIIEEDPDYNFGEGITGAEIDQMYGFPQ